MKRGYMNWVKTLLPEEALNGRRAALAEYLKNNGIGAAIIFGDVYSADELIEYTNYGPYWYNCAAIVTANGDYRLVTGHNARVNAWLVEMTGVEESQITPAGKKVHVKCVDVLKTLVPEGSKILLTGKYSMYGSASALEKNGFTVIYSTEFTDAQMNNRDESYLAVVKQGYSIMEEAVEKALKGIDLSQPININCADIEYEIRKAGAMDVYIYVAECGKAFSLPAMAPAAKWNLYLNIQYLGNWIVMAIPVGSDASDLYVVMEKAVAEGQTSISDRFEVEVKTQVVSDQISSLNTNALSLKENQVVCISVLDKETGRYAAKMFTLSEGKAIAFGKF